MCPAVGLTFAFRRTTCLPVQSKKAERWHPSQKTFTNRNALANKPEGRPPLKFDY